MAADKISDFERAEYYKARLARANNRMTVFCILTFILGFFAARAIYILHNPLALVLPHIKLQ